MVIRRAVLVLLLVVGVGPARGAPPLSERAVRAALAATSVMVEPHGSTGVLAESTQLVLTARHCVPGDGSVVRVRFTTGWVRRAWVVANDERADQAALLLEDPVPIEPLLIAHREQIPGTVLYFTGNPARPRFQRARLERIGSCPSLPQLPNALFTTIDGTPGDSGAPVVDLAGRIVGLVHGGVRCHILTPADSLVRLVGRLLDGVPLRL